MWRNKLHKVYASFEEFKGYSEVYNLAVRLGFDSPEQAWELNPVVQGSTNPADYKLATPRGNETVNGLPIRCYDNGGETPDRYTVVFMNRGDYGFTRQYIRETGRDFYPCLGMSGAPFHPQGIGQHSDCKLGRHLGKRVQFASLPTDCRNAVIRDLSEVQS